MALSSDELVSATITVGSQTFTHEFEQYTGGEQTRANVVRRTRIYHARKRIGQVTLRVIYDHATFHPLVRALDTNDGRIGVVITRQPRDADGNIGALKPRVDTGVLASDNAGDVNTEDDTEQLLELVVDIESRA